MKTNLLKTVALVMVALWISTGQAWAQDGTNGPEDDIEVKDFKEHGNKKFDWSRVIYGGFPILSFGPNFTNVGLSGTVGYRITDRFALGTNPLYTYQRYAAVNPYTGIREKSSASLYGGTLFGRFTITDFLFTQVEYELISYGSTGNTTFEIPRTTVPGFYLGAGLVQRMSRNAGMFLMLRYNFLESPYSIYPNPDYRVGFNVGI